MERLSEFPSYHIDTNGRIFNKHMTMVKPYWSERDKTLYVNIFLGKKRYTRTILSLMQATYFKLEDQKAFGKVLVCTNADFRDVRLSNLTAIDRGRAIVFKRTVYGESRFNDFYNIFLTKPNEFEFHNLPIDVQEELKNRGDLPWDTKTLGYPM